LIVKGLIFTAVGSPIVSVVRASTVVTVVLAMVSAVVMPVFRSAVVVFASKVLAVTFPPTVVLLDTHKVHWVAACAVALTVPCPVAVFLWRYMQVHDGGAID
jgi:hypothetical protein